MMYTDGLVESPGLAVSIGIANVENLVVAMSAQALFESHAVVDALVPPPRSDDICLLVARFN